MDERNNRLGVQTEMAVIVIPFHNYDLYYDRDTGLPMSEFYANQIDPEMRKWLCAKIGEPVLLQNEHNVPLWHQSHLDETDDHWENWTLLRNDNPSDTHRCEFHLDTTEAIAVEFKLRWL